MSEQPRRERRGYSGLIIGGGVVIGLGVGFITGNIPAGLFIGLGIGLIAAAILRLQLGEW